MTGKSRLKISLGSFIPSEKDVLILDSNILIKILYPAMCDDHIAPYASMYAKILAAKSKLIISSIQISEFVNRCIRFQFELYKKSHPGQLIEFKRDYRNTDDYRDCMTAILDIIKSDIIPNFAFIDDGFKDMQHDDIFKYGFSYDFNDSILLEIAKQNHAILITDDKDFGNYITKVKIVTNNQTLLMFS